MLFRSERDPDDPAGGFYRTDRGYLLDGRTFAQSRMPAAVDVREFMREAERAVP